MRKIVLIAFICVACSSPRTETKPVAHELSSIQLKAVDAVKLHLPNTGYFEVKGWHAVDTLPEWPDKEVKQAYRYTYDFDYKNRFGTIMLQEGVAIFDEKDSLLTFANYDRRHD